MLKRVLSAVVLLSVIVGTIYVASDFTQPVATAADSISELEQKQSELKKKSEEYQKELEKTKSDIKKKEQYQESLLGKIDTVNEEIIVSQEKIDTLTKRIDSKTKKIKKLNSDIENRMNTLRGRIKTIYMAGDVSSLEIILGAKNFDDFLDKCELVRNVSNYDEKLIKNIQTDMTTVKTEKSELQKSKKSQESEKEKLQTKREELQTLVDENSEVLETLYTRNKEQEETIKDNNGMMTALDDEITEYYEKKAAEEQKKAAAAAKKAAEEQAKAQQEQEKKNSNSGDATDTNPRGTSNNSGNSGNNSSSGNSGSSSNSGTSTGNSGSYTNTGSGNYVWPCPGHFTLSSVFGEDRGSYGHGAIDISDGSIMGSTVVAADGGTVIVSNNSCTHNYGKAGSCGCGGGYGNYVWIDHGNGKATIYAHLTRSVVTTGQTVSAGQVLGYVGSTGWSTGPHLHFECRLNGVRYDPMSEY